MKTTREIRAKSARLAAIAKYLVGDRRYKSNYRMWQTVKYEDLIGDFEQVARNQVNFIIPHFDYFVFGSKEFDLSL